jgi:acyl-[acyl carrier protein]--UDP-N-acetylglucosamine O-acyltransferase
VPADALGILRPVTIRAGAVIGAFAVVHGGTTVGEQARIEEHAVAGKPELGYAVGRIYRGTGGTTVIGAGSVVRCGVIVYAEVHLGVNIRWSGPTHCCVPASRWARRPSLGTT